MNLKQHIRPDSEQISERAFKDLKYYQSNLEYPVEIFISNKDYKTFKNDEISNNVLKELSKSISGYEFSELDAITQYIKHNTISKIVSDEFPELSNDLLGIAMIEMKHFEELCNFFLKFDVNMMIGSKNCLEIKANVSMYDNLNFALSGEHKTINQYKKVYNEVDNTLFSNEFKTYLKEFLNKLIKDEERHVNILEKDLDILSDIIGEMRW